MNELPKLVSHKLREIYINHVGPKAALKLQKKARLSSFFLILALLLAVPTIYCGVWLDESLKSNLFKAGFLASFFLSSRLSWWAKKSSIRKHTSYKNLDEWCRGERVTAYLNAKKVVDFKKIDVDKMIEEVFPISNSFFESKINIAVVSTLVPIWAVFLSYLELGVITKVLAFFFLFTVVVISIHAIVFTITKDSRRKYINWLRQCKEISLNKKKRRFFGKSKLRAI